MREFCRKVITLVGIVAVASGWLGCSKPDVKNETVASVNGDEIRVVELREFLGMRGGLIGATQVPGEKKKEALDRLVAGRLLAQDARGKGLDNTGEYRTAMAQNEQGAWITALFRKEMAAKGKIEDNEVKEEAGKLRESDKNLSEAEASMRAGQAVSEKRIRKIEEELVAAARKEAPATFDQEAMQRIAKGGDIGDNSILWSAGSEKITYGDVKRRLQTIPQGTHGGQDLGKNPTVIQQVLEREATGRALFLYAKKQGIEGSDWLKAAKVELERSVLVNLLAEKVLAKEGAVTEKEIRDAYAEHAQMFVRDGKKIPLSEVKEQIRGYIQNGKQRKALEQYIGELRNKAKITVNEAVLPKV